MLPKITFLIVKIKITQCPMLIKANSKKMLEQFENIYMHDKVINLLRFMNFGESSSRVDILANNVLTARGA